MRIPKFDVKFSRTTRAEVRPGAACLSDVLRFPQIGKRSPRRRPGATANSSALLWPQQQARARFLRPRRKRSDTLKRAAHGVPQQGRRFGICRHATLINCSNELPGVLEQGRRFGICRNATLNRCTLFWASTRRPQQFYGPITASHNNFQSGWKPPVATSARSRPSTVISSSTRIASVVRNRPESSPTPIGTFPRMFSCCANARRVQLPGKHYVALCVLTV